MVKVFEDLDNYFAILDIPDGAPQSQIKKAYVRMNKLFHPDKNPPPGFENKSRKIMEAYKRLTEFRHLIEWHGAMHKDVNKYIEDEQKYILWQQSEQEEQQYIELQKQKIRDEKAVEQETNKRNREADFQQYCFELRQKYQKQQ